MGIETALLGEYLIIYLFYIFGIVSYAMKNSKIRMPGFPVQTPSDDRAIMAYWMHTHGVIKKNGLRFLGIKQSTIDSYHEEEMIKYRRANNMEQWIATNKDEINARSSDMLFDAIHERNVRNK
jgi:hypothetical protein